MNTTNPVTQTHTHKHTETCGMQSSVERFRGFSGNAPLLQLAPHPPSVACHECQVVYQINKLRSLATARWQPIECNGLLPLFLLLLAHCTEKISSHTRAPAHNNTTNPQYGLKPGLTGWLADQPSKSNFISPFNDFPAMWRRLGEKPANAAKVTNG